MSCSDLDNQPPTKWVNPYKARLRQHPGRLFCFDRRDEEEREIARLVEKAGRIVCEIGSGSGNHLIARARGAAGASCFGFELRYKRAVRTIEKAEKQGVQNVFVLHERGQMIERFFPPGSVDQLYINFPEPWPKERWKKHRLFSSEFLSRIERVLRANGILAVKSDHQQYFSAFLQMVEASPALQVEHATDDLYQSAFAAENIPTEFELLFRAKGMPICSLQARKGVVLTSHTRSNDENARQFSQPEG